MSALTPDALDLLFREARTANAFRPDPVSDELLQAIWEVAKFGATAANACPLRVVFVRSPEAKERLRPALMGGNVAKTMAAPVTAIFAYDHAFYELLPRLFPHFDMASMYRANPGMVEPSGRMNAALQAAYFMIVARGMGLDCGPMAGFSNAAVDAEFFAGTEWRSLFLCNLGHADPSATFPRLPRPSFDEIAKVL